jgi:hypothetical protein
VKRVFRTVIVLALAAASAACTNNSKPRFDVEDEKATAFRRYTGRPATDYVFRWSKVAFDRVASDIDGPLSEDKTEMLERRGRPDYKRDNVKATRPETFDEWVYWDQNVLVQFIQGDLVYEGDLLDSDKTLVTYGYPSSAWSQKYEYGPTRELWVYEHLFDMGGRSYSFSDGKLNFESVN